ncbi:polysaccharide biosynthesis tyrosine autokinase [Oscillatoria sp. FACHB-1406]|uniref:GumC family protein n=1 Tax=Oscillatoria sp. FACHB-1406 TaxID=2692846 RepID=UPI001686AB0D|nr:polysaccharide biosynthesis tyrosine autokinase [Oscillatoria sp. FACHB-1406]MBD2579801.1 polysaccharide biosynthesis tyrosine autokinase [Oscillatoria sp. FACHB-1406]
MVFNSNPQPPFPSGNDNPLTPKLPLNPPALPKQNEESLNPRQLISIARRRWLLLLAVSLAVGSLVASKVLREVPRYQSQFRLLVEPIAGDERFDQFSQRLAGQLGLRLDYDTQIQVLRSPAQLEPIVAAIKTKYPEMDYGMLVGNLKLERFEGTKLIEVTYTDTNPQRIKFVLDRLAAGFIEYSKREQKTSNRKGLDFVEEQLPVLKQRVDGLQARVQGFRQQHNLMDPKAQGEKVSDRLLSLRGDRQNTQAELSQAESLSQTIQGQLGLPLDQAMTVSALSEAPRYQTLLNQLQDIETKMAIERARFTPESPVMRALTKRRNNLLPLLNEEAVAVVGRATNARAESMSASPNPVRLQLTQKLIEVTNQKQVLAVRDNALAQAEQQTARQVQEMAQLTRQYTDLERQLQIATESLNRFLSVQEDLQIESAQHTMSWELISAPPLPTAPISPNVTRGLLVASMAGILAGLSAALLAEKLDVRLHSLDEIKESLGLPVLGLIPQRRESRDRPFLARGRKSASAEGSGEKSPVFFPAVPRYRASPFLEAFRSLHANLSFISPDRPLQVLTISSSMPLEGKSTTSYHLAQAAAAMGQKVLLVDADLRRPQIHVMTDLPNVWGLSHAISMEIDVNDLIQRSPIEDNLYILTAGQIPPDPTRLLSSQKMRNLIVKLREDYDFIIFDTPPLFALADAKFLTPHADGLVLVVRLGRTDRALLKQVLDGLRVSQSSPLGLIANGVNEYSSGSYTYYHRYFKDDDSQQPQPKWRSRSR